MSGTAASPSMQSGVLVRVPAVDDWLARLPSVPTSTRVTASLTDPSEAIRCAAGLSERGYTPVGSAGGRDGGHGWVDFLVPDTLVSADPRWCRRLSGPHGRVYDPALGPVRLAFRAIIAAHAC